MATRTPDVLPVLSRGKHRRPRSGACFMEFASYLAGERWSDHPACTHPLLAALARSVNDHVDDEHRAGLVTLIPRVIGLRGPGVRPDGRPDELVVDVVLTAHAAAAAVPFVRFEAQRALAAGLRATRAMLPLIDADEAERLRPLLAGAAASAPLATQWAADFGRGQVATERSFRRHTAPRVVPYAVSELAVACINDADDRLVDVLETAVADVERLTSPVRAEDLTEAITVPVPEPVAVLSRR